MRRLALALTLLSAGPGCTTRDAPLPACDDHTPCPAPLRCEPTHNLCVQPCTRDAHCDADARCVVVSPHGWMACVPRADASVDVSNDASGDASVDVPAVTCAGADLLHDARNCGRCGVVCAAACVEGVCRPVSSIAVAQGAVYLRVEGAPTVPWYVWRAPGRDGPYPPRPDSMHRALPAPELTGVIRVQGAASVTATLFWASVDGARDPLTAWGDNEHSRLATGLAPMTAPTAVQRLLPGGSFGPVRDAVAASIGDLNGCLVSTTAGAVQCWGERAAGVTGDATAGGATVMAPSANDAIRRGDPTVSPTLLVDVAEVSVGDRVACARTTADRSVYCWGSNATQSGVVDGAVGVPGDPRGVAAMLSLTGVRQIALSGRSACAVDDSGALRCWGDPTHHLTGVVAPGARLHQPRLVATDVDHLALGRTFGCLVARSNGAVRCWGEGGAQQLGTLATTADEPMEIRFEGTPLRASRVVASGDLACALALDGRAVCWGRVPEAPSQGAGVTAVPW